MVDSGIFKIVMIFSAVFGSLITKVKCVEIEASKGAQKYSMGLSAKARQPVFRHFVINFFAVVSTFLLPWPLLAHEFWIEPSSFQPELNKSITADLVVGTDFLGVSEIYVPDQIEVFALLGPMADKPIERNKITGRYGDRPAATMAVNKAGLYVILHQTAPIYLTYLAADKFDRFAREKGFENALSEHQERGLSLTKITEQYQRFAKSLIAVGDAGSERMVKDRHLGLAIELVAEVNPYQTPPPKIMPIRLFAAGKPLANAQITVFTRHNPRDVESAKYQTDTNGRANFPLLSGRDYLVDSVILRPSRESNTIGGRPAAMWESLWASLTFQIPG